MTPEAVDRVLQDFRGWLEAQTQAGSPHADAESSWDWHELVSQFTALRHEVHLQTRAVRSQLEQTGAALASLKDATAQRAAQDEADPAPPVWLKALLEVQDALDASHREVARLAAGLKPDLEALTRPPGFWARLLGAAPAADSARRFSQLVDALLAGYAMSRQRIERCLLEEGLEPMSCVDAAFDPETMEVFEVVPAADKTPGTVVGELRRGYRWRGRPLRCALVRVAR